MRQKNVAHSQEKNQSTEADLETTEMIELVFYNTTDLGSLVMLVSWKTVPA